MLDLPVIQTIRLTSERSLSFAIYGEETGRPVYYMHGLYGSRLEALLAAEAAAKCGVQLIAADRPSVGESAAEPGRTLRSWATNIGELADHLGHERFSLFGVSGGGPYALSCACFLPERINRIALCGGLAPLDDNSFNRQLPLKYKAVIWLRHHFTNSLKWINYPLYSGARKSPEKLLKSISKHLPACDKNLLLEEAIQKVFIASLTEATKQGPRYGEEELTIFGSDWEFPLSDISLPVDIWHGDQDQVVPVAMAHHLAENIPHSKLHILPGEGHFSLPILHAEKMFRSLLTN